jgi:hypothetical protein
MEVSEKLIIVELDLMGHRWPEAIVIKKMFP